MQPSLRKLTVTALAASLLALAAAASATATPPSPVAGSAVPTSAIFSPPRTAGGNVFLEATGTHAWSGSFTGTSALAVRLVEHASGEASFQASGTFTGSTPCGTGTMSFTTEGSGQFPFFTGRLVTIDQADASLPIHADLEFTLVLTPIGAFVSYTGDVHCD
jgi:hypothetical protein